LARYTFTDTACLPFATIDFTNTSTIADATQNSFSYVWNFGDAPSGSLNSSIAIDPSHIYNAVGPFNVKLKVTSGAGCVDDTTISINTIHPQPHADFAFTKPSVCIGDEIRVIDLSNNMDGNRKLFFWEFGDGFNTTLLNPSHTYSDTGIYEVTHYVVNSFGCMSDTMIKPINVYPYPVITAGPDLQILEGQSAPLQAAAFGTQLQYLWTSGTNLNNTNILNPICAPINDIDYMLTVTGIGGCPSIDQVHIDVLKMPLIPNTFSPNSDGSNDLFYPRGRGIQKIRVFKIFNRWGQMVFLKENFFANDLNAAWDGTKNGRGVSNTLTGYFTESTQPKALNA
jgi:gliding motility-associated-like protein